MSTDNQLILHRAIHPFNFAAAVRSLCWAKGIVVDDFRRLAQNLYRTYLATGTFEEKMQVYCDICKTLDNIGGEQFIKRTYFLIALLAGQWAEEDESVTQEDINSVNETAVPLASGSYREAWYYPKLSILSMVLQLGYNTRSYIDGIRLAPGAEGMMEELEHQVGDLSAQNRAMAASLLENRKYGVKPSFFQDGILHQPGDAWVIMSAEDLAGTIDNSRFHNLGDKIALVSLARRDDIDSFDVQATRGTRDGRSYTQVGFGFGGQFIWAFDRQAELTNPFYGISVRNMFERAGKGLAYELVRFSNLYRLYNLVVPLEVVRQIPELPDAGSGIISRLPGQREKRLRRLLTPEIVLSRVRWMEGEEVKRLRRMLEQEVEEAEAETRRRTLAEHSVTGHARKLPPGHKASPEARAHAAYDKVTLSEGETYVVKHKRGGENGEKVGPHKGVIRRPQP